MDLKIKLLATLAAAALLAAGGAWLASLYYSPRLELAEQRAQALDDAYTTLASASQRQNEAITALETEAAERQRIAEAAVADARKISSVHQASALAILRAPKPSAGDPCAIARQEFDEELQNERGE